MKTGFFLLLPLLLLAACAGPQGAAGNRPLPRPQAAAGTGTGQTDQASLPPADNADLAADPGRFKGLTGEEVQARLGEPSFRRRDPPAEIWQYYGPGCVLDLFLYDENGARKVAYAEVRQRDSLLASGSDCLGSLLDGRRSRSG